MKISQDQRACDAFPGVARAVLDARTGMHFDEIGTIGGGGNSGYQALNLAAQWGARDIALVGFDMSVTRGVHWHGAHSDALHNPNSECVSRWASDLARAAPHLASLGVIVTDCALSGALRCWPKMTFSDWLRGG